MDVALHSGVFASPVQPAALAAVVSALAQSSVLDATMAANHAQRVSDIAAACGQQSPARHGTAKLARCLARLARLLPVDADGAMVADATWLRLDGVGGDRFLGVNVAVGGGSMSLGAAADEALEALALVRDAADGHILARAEPAPSGSWHATILPPFAATHELLVMAPAEHCQPVAVALATAPLLDLGPRLVFGTEWCVALGLSIASLVAHPPPFQVHSLGHCVQTERKLALPGGLACKRGASHTADGFPEFLVVWEKTQMLLLPSVAFRHATQNRPCVAVNTNGVVKRTVYTSRHDTPPRRHSPGWHVN